MSAFLARITTNLRERVHPVNAMVAINGIHDLQAGHRALNVLVAEGTVIKTVIHGAPLYKLNPNQRTIPSTGNLSLVK